MIRENSFFGFILLLPIIFFLAACNNDESNPINETPHSFNAAISAYDLVSKMTVGWNLGNTLDAHSDGKKETATATVAGIERKWVGRVTTKENITALREAGFNTIRIPVTWFKVCDEQFNIREDWMARVREIVDYAVDNDMYILLNTHHDEYIFKFMDAEIEESLKTFKKIWEQIADTFKWYNEKLVFEGLNEPRTKGSRYEWSGGTQEERDNLNTYYQVFVDTVRASGGYNDKRLLLINTYAASSGEVAVNALKLPVDIESDRIIVSIHAYEPYNFALNTGTSAVSTWDENTGSATIKQLIDRAYYAFVHKGIPVIIGEFGAMDRNNEATRALWAEFYTSYAKKMGMPCIWWDNHVFSGNGERFGLLNRATNTFTYPLVVEGLMKGAGVIVSEP